MSDIKEDNINNTPDKNIHRYQQVEGPSYRQLEWGLWWIENKRLLKNILLGILLLLSTIFWTYSLFYLVRYSYTGVLQDQLLVQSSVKSDVVNNNFITASQAVSLQIGSVQVIPSFDHKTYDFVATISNPNTDWYATFDYIFIVNQNNMSSHHDFIIPNEKKYVTHFLYEDSYPSDVRLEVTNIRWTRIDRHETGDIANYIKEHKDIDITDVNVRSDASALVPVNYLDFKINNNSAYNYWSADFYITITSGTRLLGINKYTLPQLMSGEERTVEIFWPGNWQGGKITITPSINIFDKDNYMPFNLGSGQPK